MKNVIQGTTLSGTGAVSIAPGAEITIRNPAGQLVPLWADRAGTQPHDNPFLTDSEGQFRVYADSGWVHVRAQKDGSVREWRYVPLGSAAAMDIGEVYAALGSEIYSSVSEGLSNSAEGDYFLVESSGSLDLYRVVNGVAEQRELGIEADAILATRAYADGVAAEAESNATNAAVAAASSAYQQATEYSDSRLQAHRESGDHDGRYYTKTEIDQALDGKVDDSDPRLSDARDWIAPMVTQAEVEGGESTEPRKWSVAMVKLAAETYVGHWAPVRPEGFGAVGDGVTDDAAALAAAFSAAAGGEIQLTPGKTYVSSTAQVLPEATTLQLNGAKIKFTPDGEVKCLELRSRTRVLNGEIDCTGTNISGDNNGDVHCPILIGDYDGGIGYSDIVVDGVTITSNRENGNGILVTGDSHNIVLRNLRFPDSATMGRPILLHWGGRNGGAPVATTHPRNITIDNVLVGHLTRRGQNAAVIFLSAVYDVHIRNVFADECDVGVFVFAGDYGYSFATKNQQWVGTNIVIENLSIIKHHAQGVRVLGKPYISGNNLAVPVVIRNARTNGDPEGSGGVGILLEYCTGVSVSGGRVGVVDYGIKIGAGANQCRITGTQIFNVRRSGVFIHDTERPPEGTVLQGLNIAMVNTIGAQSGTDRAGIYVDSSSQTRILHNEIGLHSGEQGLYGVRVTANAVGAVLDGNYVRGVAAGGVAYTLGAYGQALGQNNGAAAGIPLFGDVKLPTRIGESYYWTDATGKLRVSGTIPTSDTSGVVVGTQA